MLPCPEFVQIMNEKEMFGYIKQIASSIVEDPTINFDNLALIGLRGNGLFLANQLAFYLEKTKHVSLPVGCIDNSSLHWKFDLFNKQIILVDDILYTGRSIRKALFILEEHKLSIIRLGVLIDLNWHELPISADYTGISINISTQESIKMTLKFDEECKVFKLPFPNPTKW